jgi:hypothetical protein
LNTVHPAINQYLIELWLQYALDFMPRGDISEMPDTVIIPDISREQWMDIR